MKTNDPRRNLISTWSWGKSVDIYEPSKAPRWILNKGALLDPCDVAGCKEFIRYGHWYVRHPFLGVVCADCAETFGAVRGDAADQNGTARPR
jgi:hypothetical protein